MTFWNDQLRGTAINRGASLSHDERIRMTGSNYVQIQVDIGNPAGSWRTMNTVMNNAQIIAHAMQSLSNMQPGKRIRAVDENGRVVDML